MSHVVEQEQMLHAKMSIELPIKLGKKFPDSGEVALVKEIFK